MSFWMTYFNILPILGMIFALEAGLFSSKGVNIRILLLTPIACFLVGWIGFEVLSPMVTPDEGIESFTILGAPMLFVVLLGALFVHLCCLSAVLAIKKIKQK